MDLQRCFELMTEVTSAQGAQGVTMLGDAERIAVLDLARVVAHTVERSAAPLACFAVGQVVAGTDAAARLALLNALTERLSAELPAEPTRS